MTESQLPHTPITKRIVDPAEVDVPGRYRLLIGAITPRPIAWVSTVTADGRRNLAPFSYFMPVSHRPPMLAFSINRRGVNKKDTLANIEATGEFVVNVATLPNAVAMNETSGDYGPDVDEFEKAGVTPVAAEMVKAALVAEAPINMECKLLTITYLGEETTQSGIVVGEIVRWHIAEHLFDERGGIDVTKVETISRLSYDNYGYPVTIFSRPRPKV